MTYPNSTTDYWEFNGLSLETLAWGIDKWGGSLESVPKRRGGMITVPHRPGQVWTPQVTDSRTLTFAMWVTCNDPADGTVPVGQAAQEAQLLDNWAELRAAFWGVGTAEKTLTKRWTGGYNVASGLASFVGGLEPTGFGMQMARFTVDLFMADPYFYGPSDVRAITTAGGDITNAGDDATARITLAFSGSSTGSYVLTNTTTSEALTITNTGTIAVDVWNFAATKSAASILGNVSSTGDPFWLTLATGVNSFTLNRNDCNVTWTPAYL